MRRFEVLISKKFILFKYIRKISKRATSSLKPLISGGGGGVILLSSNRIYLGKNNKLKKSVFTLCEYGFFLFKNKQTKKRTS